MENRNVFNPEYIRQIKGAANLSDIIHDAIKEAIVSGKLDPGMKLKQIELAERFGVSQQTVREALKRLVSSGWVVQKPNRGFNVSDISFKEQDHIFELRMVLETYAMETAAREISDEDLARMRNLLPLTASPERSLSEKQVEEYNHDFHMIPVQALNNPHLVRILENLWDLLWVYHLRHENDELERQAARLALEEHEQILLALENHDPQAVREAVQHHLKATKSLFDETKKIH